MTRDARTTLVAFIVLFGFFARAATYKAPLLDHHGWRQADTASVARNFVRERFNIFYPQIDQRGAQATGYVETGLEVFAFAVAGVARLAGFHHEIGRVLASLCFLASCLLTHAFVRRRYGDEAALAGAFAYAFGFPLMLFMERAFMNEALLVALSLACLLSTQRYLARRSLVDLVTLFVCSTLIALIKLPYLIVWAPIAGLFLERDGPGVWRRWELWLMAAVNVGAAALWYPHAHALGASTGLSFGITNKLFNPETVFSVSYPRVMLERLLRDILGPVGLVVILVAGWGAVRERRWCEILGVAGFGAYLILVAEGNFVHDYYQIAIMPIAAILAGPGVLTAGEWLTQRFGRLDRANWVAALLAIAALSSFVRFVSANGWFEYDARDVVLCDLLRETTAPGDRVLFIGDNNPMFLVCADRKGWALSAEASDAGHVSEARQQGARVAVLHRPGARPDLQRLLASWGSPVMANPAVEVYRLHE